MSCGLWVYNDSPRPGPFNVCSCDDGGRYIFIHGSGIIAPAKFGLGSSTPIREADVFTFGLVLQVLCLYCTRFLRVSAQLRRLSQGNLRSVTQRFTSVYMRSSRGCGRENLRKLRLSGSLPPCGSLPRCVGVKIRHNG